MNYTVMKEVLQVIRSVFNIIFPQNIIHMVVTMVMVVMVMVMVMTMEMTTMIDPGKDQVNKQKVI